MVYPGPLVTSNKRTRRCRPFLRTLLTSDIQFFWKYVTIIGGHDISKKCNNFWSPTILDFRLDYVISGVYSNFWLGPPTQILIFFACLFFYFKQAIARTCTYLIAWEILKAILIINLKILILKKSKKYRFSNIRNNSIIINLIF